MAIGRLDAHGQAELVRSGELSAKELVEAAIARIEALDPALNAVTHRAFEQALQKASTSNGDSALRSVPYLLKDGMDYAGMPSRSGSRLKKNAPPLSAGSEYSNRLDRAGLIPLGKTNAPEFGLLPTTEPVLYGPSRNPWNIAHSSGGSSGGAGAVVAAGMVALAHAADGGGSIRIPASCCGVFGLKPSRAANVRARGPHIIEDFLVGDTLLSRSVRDAAWGFAVTAPDQKQPLTFNPKSRRLRIGFALENFNDQQPSPDVAAVIRRSAELCQRLGHTVEEIKRPFDGPAVDRAFKLIWAYLAQDLVSWSRATLREGRLEDVLEPWTMNLGASSGSLTLTDVDRIFDEASTAARALEDFYSRYDVLLTPVLKHSPLPLGALAPTQAFEPMYARMFDYVSYTPLQNLTGTPAMSVPLYMSENGLPVGSMFAAGRGQDELLLQLAFELEQAEPWAGRWPKFSVGTGS
jgi:amidase